MDKTKNSINNQEVEPIKHDNGKIKCWGKQFVLYNSKSNNTLLGKLIIEYITCSILSCIVNIILQHVVLLYIKYNYLMLSYSIFSSYIFYLI